MSTLFFTSQKNALKRDDSSGTALMAAPKTSAYSGLLFVTNLVIPHNLGYSPLFRVYSEPFGDGVIWPPLAGRSNGGDSVNPLNSSQLGPGVIGSVDNTNLYLQLFSASNTYTGKFPVYWVIYRDFPL